MGFAKVDVGGHVGRSHFESFLNSITFKSWLPDRKADQRKSKTKYNLKYTNPANPVRNFCMQKLMAPEEIPT